MLCYLFENKTQFVCSILHLLKPVSFLLQQDFFSRFTFQAQTLKFECSCYDTEQLELKCYYAEWPNSRLKYQKKGLQHSYGWTRAPMHPIYRLRFRIWGSAIYGPNMCFTSSRTSLYKLPVSAVINQVEHVQYLVYTIYAYFGIRILK